jgi:hypothetical protein
MAEKVAASEASDRKRMLVCVSTITKLRNVEIETVYS